MNSARSVARMFMMALVNMCLWPSSSASILPDALSGELMEDIVEDEERWMREIGPGPDEVLGYSPWISVLMADGFDDESAISRLKGVIQARASPDSPIGLGTHDRAMRAS